MKTKKEIRQQIIEKRDALTFEKRQELSKTICESVCELPGFKKADHILCFASYGTEVMTNRIFEKAIASNKSVFYPKVIGNDMKFYQIFNKAQFALGYKGILEPCGDTEEFVLNPSLNTLMIMPGVCYDKEGNRIGYGKGFYDRFLETLDQTVYKVAVAFSCQILTDEMIPVNEQDIKPDIIITENQIITTNEV